MAHRALLLVMLQLLLGCQRHVVLTIIDPDDLASEVVAIAHGGNSYDMMSIVLKEGQRLPLTMTLSAPFTESEGLLWVEALAEEGHVLGRGRVKLDFDVGSSRVELAPPCDVGSSSWLSCALEDGSGNGGTCMDGACLLAFCGNGLIEEGETCDDGDADDRDGCSSDCVVESDHVCYAAPSVCFVLKDLPAGEFVMGSPETEPGREDIETQHPVRLTRGFSIMAHEVTQDLFENATGWNPSYHRETGDEAPVDGVTWFDALAFANRLSEMVGLSPCYVFSDVVCSDGRQQGADAMGCFSDEAGGISEMSYGLGGLSVHYECSGFRLPSEAEWEYAARAGTTTAYYNGESASDALECEESALADIAWYCFNAQHFTMPVGQLQPNTWGLYDMAGNIYEWVWDTGYMFSGNLQVDPDYDHGSNRVARGGSWGNFAASCRSAYRTSFTPGYDERGFIGLRLVRTQGL